MFGILKKRQITQAERHLQFIKDLAKVYWKHSQYLTPKEMEVLSKGRTTSAAWINSVCQSVINRWMHG